jgi:protein disulfide-isomerase A1
MTVDSLSHFITQFKSASLKPVLKSQDIPPETNETLHDLVGKTFKRTILDTPNDAMVLFYAPWCTHCEEFMPKYKKLAQDLKNVKGLLIARIDATANDVDGVVIRGYPTIKFYSKDDK